MSETTDRITKIQSAIDSGTHIGDDLLSLNHVLERLKNRQRHEQLRDLRIGHDERAEILVPSGPVVVVEPSDGTSTEI